MAWRLLAQPITCKIQQQQNELFCPCSFAKWKFPQNFGRSNILNRQLTGTNSELWWLLTNPAVDKAMQHLSADFFPQVTETKVLFNLAAHHINIAKHIHQMS